MTWHAPHVLPAQAAAIDQQSAERRYWADAARSTVTLPVADGWRNRPEPAIPDEAPSGLEELARAVARRYPACGQCDHSIGRHRSGTNKCRTCGKRCRRAEPETDGQPGT